MIYGGNPNLTVSKQNFFDDQIKPRVIVSGCEDKIWTDFPEKDFLFKGGASTGLASQGIYQSTDMVEKVLEGTRKKMEGINNLQAFQFLFDSTSGTWFSCSDYI